MRTREEIRNADWFGLIPDGWEMKPLKTLFTFSKGLSITKADLTETGVPVVNYGQIHSKAYEGTGITDGIVRHVSPSTVENSGTSFVRKGGFVFADTSEDLPGVGNCAYNDGDGKLYGGYHTIVLTPRHGFDNKFLAYLFRTDAWRQQLRRQLVDVKLFSVNQGILSEAYVVLPPVDIRHAIVSYLDVRCTPIDEAIARHREAIGKLEEYRRAVITKTVTKGLDPNAPMKDSGIGWIGMVPATWEAKRIKFVAKLASGGTPSRDHAEYWDGDIPWVTTGDLTGARVNSTMESISRLGLDNSSSKVFPRRTVLVAMYGGAGTIGKCGILDGDFAINQALCAVSCGSELNPDYLLYQMHALRPYWMRHAAGTRKDPNISQALIANESIAVPSYDEQVDLVAYLDCQCAAVDDAIGRQNQIIGKLEEYRRSLIHAAVTGKIDCTKGAMA